MRRVLAGCAALAIAAMGAGPALADDPSAAPGTLPGIAQQRTGNGCLPAGGTPVTAVPWPQAYLRPDQAWPLAEGQGVTVAVLGSGADDTAGALGGRLTRAPRLPGGGGDPARDCVGHGTFLADLIAAARHDGTGFAGVAPAARLLAVGVTDDTGATNPALLAAGLRTAADAGARVICVGATVPQGSDELHDAVRYAVAKGALVVAPAGADSGQQPLAAAYPAGYPEVLAVRDLGPGGAPATNTSYAGGVDLAAPGDSVMSLGPGGTGYFTGSGASFAAAFTSGAAALVLSRTPDLTPTQLTHRLLTTAYPSAVPSLDLVAAVTDAAPTSTSPAPSPPLSALAMPTRPKPSPAPAQAVTVALAALAAALLTGLAALVVPRGRRQGWRPGS
ncbi:S8 family serine peptidase [Kitasatospora viridis]|uniref:S8 family serine peptidase n=1 Tax=Kitasatospora viridis TaxID=281105 RepID=UPI0011A157B8|nr:S8 family serine peptidase [Kitasatospora viridis]